MPAGTFLSFMTIFGFSLPAMCVVLLQMTNAVQPGISDAWAVLGGMLASAVVVIVDGSPSGWRSRWQLTASFVSSAFVGSLAPGIMVHSILPIALGSERLADMQSVLTWHLWAMSGFGFGLIGWAMVRAIMSLRGRVTDRIEREGAKYLDKDIPPSP